MEDTETTFTSVFDPRTAEQVTEGFYSFTHVGALCDLSTLMPPSTVSHDCPESVLGKTCAADCSYGTAAISRTRGVHCIDVRF